MPKTANCTRLAWRRHRYINKTLLVMKLTVILLTAGFLNVYATGVSQNVSFSGQNVPLESVFSSVKKQTGFVFLYSKAVLKLSKPVSINVRNVSLKEFISEVFKSQPLEYLIEGKSIFISPKPVVLSSGLQSKLPVTDKPLFNAGRVIRGRVVDEKKEPLAGATLRLKKSGRIYTSDLDGFFEIKNINEDNLMVISYTGYQQLTILLDEKTYYDITLKPADNSLDELVVKAYGTTSRRLNTGNISTVKSNDIQQQPVVNVLQALEGQVPGLNISQTNGLPGSNPTVNIRGRSSILDSKAIPLYVIDGVPFNGAPVNQNVNGSAIYAGAAGLMSPLATLNPGDIESVEVLKDADATAIYGSRAANGVILITTKKGISGKTKLNIGLTMGSGRVPGYVNLMNTQQYLEIRREAYKNDPTLTLTPATAPDLLVWNSNTNTDWQKALIGGNAASLDASVNLSGGESRTRFLVSGNYHKENTVFPGNFNYERGNFHANVEHSSLDRKLNVGFSVYMSKEKNKMPTTDFTNIAFNLAPNFPLYDSLGKLYWGGSTGNPYASLNAVFENNSTNLLANLSFRYAILKDLYIKANLGFSKLEMSALRLMPASSQNPAFTPTITSLATNNITESFIAEPQAEYNKIIGKGKLNVLAGATWQHTSNEQPYAIVSQYTSDALLYALTGASSISATRGSNESKYISLFGRINYNWNNRYNINASIRRDGSSNFGENNRFGNFGAIGAAWIFSEENFLKNMSSWLSYGKLRGSYGTTGNDAGKPYGYLSSYQISSVPYGTDGSASPARIANNNYKWESTRKLELGLDIGFLKDRILLNTSWYRNRSNNLLVDYTISAQAGFTSYTTNLPAVIENTGWEFDLSTINIKNKNFSWTSGFNLSLPRNKLVEYPNLSASSNVSNYVIDKPLNLIARYIYAGVDPATGVATIVDANHDGRITFGLYENGMGDRKIIGSTDPDFYGGLRNSFHYKNFQLDILIQYAQKLGQSENALITQSIGGPYNTWVGVMDRWKNPGDITNIPRAGITGTAVTNFILSRTSDITNRTISYAKLRSVSLSYKLPKKLLKGITMENCQVYVRGLNLFTLTNYKGYDPETQGIVLPMLRSVYAGLQITF